MNVDLFDINGDGFVDYFDIQAANGLFGVTTAQIILRYVAPPNANADGYSQLPYDLNNDGVVDVADFNICVQNGVPFEMLFDIYAIVSGYDSITDIPTPIYESLKSSWIANVTNGTWSGYSWYPIAHNPVFPISSAPAEQTEPVPSTNPAPSPPPISDNSLHPLDINQDGLVDVFDAIQGGQQYGATLGQMVIKYVNGDTNYYDVNGDGIVDISDIQLAQQSGVPASVLQHMLEQVMNPPPVTSEYEPNPELDSVSSPYHPLDINEDGNVDLLDMVSVASKDWSQVAKQLVVNMIQKYINNQNPYDINGDGVVSVLDIQTASQNNLPGNIIQDMANNIGSAAEQPQLPTPAPPPPEPGPMLAEFGLYVEQGQYTLLNGTSYYGPAHRFYNNIGQMMWTEALHKTHSRLLVAVIPEPAPATLETPPGQVNLPSIIQQGQNSGLQSSPFGGVGDVNGDGVIDVLDVIANQNQQSPPPIDFGNFNLDLSNSGMFNFGSGINFGNNNNDNQVGGGPSNNNNQNNTGGGTGGGGAY
tara:strand:- start:245 stop:1837 length:1593 start_codon:yes stop_codon:yes gene_type:complete